MVLRKEPMLTEEPDRLAIEPIVYPDIWSFYKRLQSNTWTAEEITFKDDLAQIKNGDVKPEILRVVEFVLGFFSGADTIVNANLASNMMQLVHASEASFFYALQMANENVHNETYSNTIVAYYRDEPERKRAVLNAVSTMPCIKQLFRWSQTWVNRTVDDELALCRDDIVAYVTREYGAEAAENTSVLRDVAHVWYTAKLLVAFACVEGILFSAAFAVIFWIKEQGVLPGLTFSNELISVDEGLHRDFACLLFSKLHHKPPAAHVERIIRDAVGFELEFVQEMLETGLIGLNADGMGEYVRFTADSLSEKLGYARLFDASNPFPFMDKISINGVTNFFEKRVAEYSLSGFEEGRDDAITLDDEDDY